MSIYKGGHKILGSGAPISDGTVSEIRTWSSKKINDELTARAPRPEDLTSFEIVDSLPTTDIKTNAIYLTREDASAPYNAYIYKDSKWEPIGVFSADIADFATNQQVEDAEAAAKEYTDDQIATKMGTVYKLCGSSLFDNLPAPAESLLGNVYNVTDAFTTTSAFVEGAGIKCTAGTNVVVVTSGGAYKYDLLGVAVDTSSFALDADLQAHIDTKSGNPHEVTKAEVGLGNVDNTADADKPVSTATQTALDAKANVTDVANIETALNNFIKTDSTRQSITGVDLDTVRVAFVYANTCLNRPTTYDGVLISNNDGNYGSQLYLCNSYETYRRFVNAGVWSAWESIPVGFNESNFAGFKSASGDADVTFADCTNGEMILNSFTKNLFDYRLIPTQTSNGVTFTNNNNGSFTISGSKTDSTKTASTSRTLTHEESLAIFSKPGWYCITVGDKLSPQFYFDAYYNGTWDNAFLNSSSVTSYRKLITESILAFTDFKVRVGFHSGGSSSVSARTVYPCLTYSQTEEPYVPYDRYDIIARGKNLFNMAGADMNRDYSWGSGANVDETGSVGYGMIKVIPGRIYKANYKFYVCEYTPAMTFLRQEQNIRTSFTPGNDVGYIKVVFRKGINGGQDMTAKTDIMLCEVASDSESVSYVPYQAETKITVGPKTQTPAIGLRSYDGYTEIMAPGNVSVTYPVSEAGRQVSSMFKPQGIGMYYTGNGLITNAYYDSSAAPRITASEDFNNYVEPGTYQISSSATTNSIVNIPETAAGLLTVYKIFSSSELHQRYETYTGNIYMRYRNSSKQWEPWRSLNPQVAYFNGNTTDAITWSVNSSGMSFAYLVSTAASSNAPNKLPAERILLSAVPRQMMNDKWCRKNIGKWTIAIDSTGTSVYIATPPDIDTSSLTTIADLGLGVQVTYK